MMVVEDCANTAPTTKAAAGDKPASHATVPTTAVVSATCPVPSDNTWSRSARICGSEKLSPIVNSRKTMPNSASTRSWWPSMTGPGVYGPSTTPTSRYPRLDGMRSRWKTATTATAASSRIRS